MTLTKFMVGSTWVAHAFEWEKLLKCHLKGKTSKKLANGQNIDYLKKENGPRTSSSLALGLNTIIFKHVYWYMQQTQVSVYRTIVPLVSSPEPKAHGELIVWYLTQRPCVCAYMRSHFQRSSSLKPLGQSKPNFI